MSLRNVSKDFVFDNMIATGLNGKVYDSSVSYETIGISDIEVIQKYLIYKHNIR